MLKILLSFLFLLNLGELVSEPLFSACFDKTSALSMENTRDFTLCLIKQNRENFFARNRIWFQDSVSIIKRKNFIFIKEKDLFLIFSDPEERELKLGNLKKREQYNYQKIATTKVVKNRRLYYRKMLLR